MFLLHPILMYFVGAFTNAKTGAPQDLDFWSRICYIEAGGFGPAYLSGWITTFCIWDRDGNWMRLKVEVMKPSKTWYGTTLPLLQLDGIFYLMINLDSVLVEFSDIDVKLNDNEEEFECMMVLGLIWYYDVHCHFVPPHRCFCSLEQHQPP